MVIGDVTTTVKVAHMWLCHSRMFYVRAYPRENQEMVLDAHDRALAFFGGAWWTRSIEDGNVRSLNGAPFLSAPHLRASTGR